MKRHFWLHAGSIALAIFALLSQLSCAKTEDISPSHDGKAEVAGTDSRENNSNIPSVRLTNPQKGAKAQALNASISASFSMPMDKSTISPESFNVKDAKGALVAGSVGMDATSQTAIFKPAQPLACGSAYTATINTQARCDGPGEISEPLPQDFMWSFETGPCGMELPAPLPLPLPPPGGLILPLPGGPGGFEDDGGHHRKDDDDHHKDKDEDDDKDHKHKKKCLRSDLIALTSPANNESGVSVSSTVSASFTQHLDAATITTSTFTLTGPGGIQVSGTVSYNALTDVATFTPDADLLPGTSYTARLEGGKNGIENAHGKRLCKDYVWRFTTEADTTPPIVIATSPICGSTDVGTNQSVSVSFSEAMNPASINGTSFTLTGPGLVLVPGSVTFVEASNIATFTPTADLAPNTLYTITIKGAPDGVQDLAGNFLVSDFVCSFTTGAGPDVIPPIVIATNPLCGAVGVILNQIVSVEFSEAMNPLSINDSTFTISGPGPTPVAGTVTYDLNSHVATFTPFGVLLPNTEYTITIEGSPDGVQDAAGNFMVSDFICSFTTGEEPDTTPPIVIANIPVCGSTGVPLNQIVTATFNEAMNPLSINILSFALTGPGATIVEGVVTYDVNTFVATFTPSDPLSPLTTYTLTIKGGAPDGVSDAAGNFMVSDVICSFTTGAAPDITPPTVIDTVPTPCGATDVPTTQNIVVTFSEPMLASSINILTFLVVDGGAVEGVVSLDVTGTIATFTPNNPLLPNTLYTFTIVGGLAGVKDLAGNSMVADFDCEFTTGASGSPDPVLLGAASSFAIFANDTITNTGESVVGGDVGLDPGSSVVGFTTSIPSGPGIVEPPFAIHINDTAANNARAALQIAYDDAAGRTLNVQPLPPELAGLTLTPGLYNNASAVSNSGTLTLDAQGNSNAVFIFQIGTTLTAGVNSQIVLAGGAKASNIFWQVGSSATLNTNAIFKGTIMAAVTITTGDSVDVDGRLLAGANDPVGGAVTLINTAVAIPTP